MSLLYRKLVQFITNQQIKIRRYSGFDDDDEVLMHAGRLRSKVEGG